MILRRSRFLSFAELYRFRNYGKMPLQATEKTVLWVSLGSQGVTKKDDVLLVLMKRETERRFCAVLSHLRRTRRRRQFRKSPWCNGFCGQKESRHSDGCLTIGSGEWNRTIDLQVMSLMSYHCSTPRYAKYNILPKDADVKAPRGISAVGDREWRKYLHILSSPGLQMSPCEVSLSTGMFFETNVNQLLNFGAIP